MADYKIHTSTTTATLSSIMQWMKTTWTCFMADITLLMMAATAVGRKSTVSDVGDSEILRQYKSTMSLNGWRTLFTIFTQHYVFSTFITVWRHNMHVQQLLLLLTALIDQPLSRESLASLNLVNDRAAHPVYDHSCSWPCMPPTQTDDVRNESSPGHTVPAQSTAIWYSRHQCWLDDSPPTPLLMAMQQQQQQLYSPLSVHAHFDCMVASVLSTLSCLCLMSMQYSTPDRLTLGLQRVAGWQREHEQC